MSQRRLEPNIDAYGTHARVSALADFVELLALHGQSKPRGTLSDEINDWQWGTKLEEQYDNDEESARDTGEGEGIADTPEDAAERIVSLLEQRKAVLDDRYPFTIDEANGSLTLIGSEQCPYLVLLGITLAHAFRIEVDPKPHVVFEDTVVSALTNVGHHSVNFSRLRRRHSNFANALKEVGALLNLEVLPLAARTKKAAQDAGVDVIAHVRDGYTNGEHWSSWTLLGQVTCGQSDTWASKLGEVKAKAWAKRLVSEVLPLPFLAIPHHADPEHLFELVEADGKMVLDRLRLTLMLNEVSDDEETILAAVRSAPIPQ